MFLFKISDNTGLLTLLIGSELNHGPALSESVNWCDDNYVDLNVSESEEMVTDFNF